MPRQRNDATMLRGIAYKNLSGSGTLGLHDTLWVIWTRLGQTILNQNNPYCTALLLSVHGSEGNSKLRNLYGADSVPPVVREDLGLLKPYDAAQIWRWLSGNTEYMHTLVEGPRDSTCTRWSHHGVPIPLKK